VTAQQEATGSQAQEIFRELLEPAGMADPYPHYARLHALGQAIRAGDGLVLVPGYEAASAVLRDPRFLVPDAERLDRVYPGWRDHPSLSAESLLNLNGERHARIRGLMAREFTARRVRDLRPAVERLTDALLDAMAERGSGGEPVDFMDEFAFALPVTVICELIGVPERDRAPFRPLARSLTATLEPLAGAARLAEADEAAVALGEMMSDLVALRRARPAGDLLSALVAACDAGDGRITGSELLHNLILLLVAGFETTTNLLGNGLAIAMADRAVAQGMRTGEVAAEAFVEEVLRFDSPVQFAGDRRPAGPTRVGGILVGPDDHVVLMTGAANRDPRRFTEPGRFWPGRPGPGPLSFGGGLHFCLGAALARLEGAVAFPRVLRRFPGIEPAAGPERRAGVVLRGYEHLPVAVGRILRPRYGMRS